MTDVEPLMVDELRREFRRTRPPRRAMLDGWQAAIFRVTVTTPETLIGYKIMWFPADREAQALRHTCKNTLFELLEFLNP